MNSDFLVMLDVYRCGLFGKELDKEITVTPKACRYAAEQNILPMFYAGIERLKSAEKVIVPDEIYQKIKIMTLGMVMNNEKRLSFIHNVLGEFQEKGIDYCVLKGESLSVMYEDKSCRISGDTDIFIDENDIAKVSKILKEKGFSVEPIFPTEHHMVARHPVGGVLECHFKLYDDHMSESLFGGYNNKSEDFCEIDCDFGKIKTLGINDGFNFVFFHYVKHLLSEGVGIRQLADVLMYSRFYKDKIDWEKVSDMLKTLGFAKLFDTMITTGTEYLGFSQSDLPPFTREKSLAEELLLDVQNGGVFGFNEIERKNFRYMILERRRRNKALRLDIKRIVYIAFPHRQILEKRYSYLKKSVLLYPVAWIQRVIDVVVLRKGRADIKGALDPASVVTKTEAVEKRLEMMKRLEIIE